MPKFLNVKKSIVPVSVSYLIIKHLRNSVFSYLVQVEGIVGEERNFRNICIIHKLFLYLYSGVLTERIGSSLQN